MTGGKEHSKYPRNMNSLTVHTRHARSIYFSGDVKFGHWTKVRKHKIESTKIKNSGEEDVPTGQKDTCSTMFIAALFITARSWKEPRCPSTEEWIQKRWYIYTMEYYSAIKKNEFTKFLDKWMYLEDIFLSELNLSQKNTHDMHSLLSGY